MARIRTVKPELGAHEGLYDLEVETGLPIRFAWCMLFTVADREGRFVWRPRTLKAQTLPHDQLDYSRVLDAWLTRGYVVKYRVRGEWYGWIPTFTKHQIINNRESPSDLPSVEEADEVVDNRFNNLDACVTRESRDDDKSASRGERDDDAYTGERKGKEGDSHASRDVLELHESLPREEWDEWLGFRRKRRWPCDPLTLRKQLKLLAQFDTQTQREMLECSIRSNWQGVFPPKTGPLKPPKPAAQQDPYRGAI